MHARRSRASPAQALSAALVALLPVASAVAEGPAAKFEVTPYFAYRIGGEFEQQDAGADLELRESSAHGVLLDIRAQANTQWEFLYAQQSTELVSSASFADSEPVDDLVVEYFHFGGTYLFDGTETRPFVALTVGAARFEPEDPGLDPETFFSASLGAGVHLRATNRVGFRLEGRAFLSLIDSDSALFCRSGGSSNVCAIRLEGTALTQWEVRAGVTFRF
jgi:hypothetical protein